MDLKLGTEGFSIQCRRCGKFHQASRYGMAKRFAENCKCKKGIAQSDEDVQENETE
jgi:hypothetical protein